MLLNNTMAGIGFAKYILEDYNHRAPDSSIHADFRNQRLDHDNWLAWARTAGGNLGF
jgi:hypothetical protein